MNLKMLLLLCSVSAGAVSVDRRMDANICKDMTSNEAYKWCRMLR